MQDNNQLEEQLIPLENLQEIVQNQNDQQIKRKMTKLFISALDQFKTSNLVLSIFQVIKILSPLTFIFNLSCGYVQTEYCIFGFTILAFFSFFYYLKMYQLCKNENLMTDIAEQNHQVYYVDQIQQEQIQLLENQGYSAEEIQQQIFQQQIENQINAQNQDQSSEYNRKVSLLSQQIKLECKKKDKICLILGTFQFVIFQALFGWGLQLLFSNVYSELIKNQSNLQCFNQGSNIYLFIIMIFAVYQYLDIYLFIIVIALLLPFVVVYALYSLIKHCLQKKIKNNFSAKIKGINYDPKLIRGEQECSICMNNYQISEKIVILPCQGKHHFHQDCIKQWLVVSTNCPHCREELLNINLANNQNDQQQI